MTTAQLIVLNAKKVNGDVIDVVVDDQKVSAVGKGVAAGVDATTTIEASGLTMLPGIVDPHTHLNFPFDMHPGDVLASETLAAAAGGITTVGNYPLGIRTDLIEHLANYTKSIDEASHVDVALSYPILEPDHVDQMDALFAAGVTSFKLMRAYRPPDVYTFGGVDDTLLFSAMIKVAEMNRGGQRALLKVHCENVEIYGFYKEQFQSAYPDLGKYGPLDEVTWAHCRPSIVEVESVVSALYLAEALGCPMMIVHLSSGESLQPIREAQAKGVDVLVETTPMYLETNAYTTGCLNGPAWTRVQPSVKFEEDSAALWQALRDGTVDVIGTDHAASTKDVYEGKSVWDDGASGRSLLGISLPIMLDASSRGLIELERLQQVMCETPARVMGLDHRKGKLEVGYDADFVLCDLNETRTVRIEDLHSRADYTCFEGRSLTGWPVRTVLRGQSIWESGRLIHENRGTFMRGL